MREKVDKEYVSKKWPLKNDDKLPRWEKGIWSFQVCRGREKNKEIIRQNAITAKQDREVRLALISSKFKSFNDCFSKD